MKKTLTEILKMEGANHMLRIAGLLFKEAKTQEELRLVYETRYKIYKESGYIKVNKEKIFIDKYDPYSINFVIYKHNKPIGTARLVLNSKVGFPTENLFNFKKIGAHKNKIAEVSRLAIDKEYRGGNRMIIMGLIKIIHDYIKRIGIEYLYVNIPEKLKRYFGLFGIRFYKLKELPPTKTNLQERALIGGYFKQKKLEPYILNIKEAKQIFRL